MPSADITEPRDVYLQQQSTLTDRLDLSIQAMLGLGSQIDAGLSLYNFDLRRSGGALHLASNHSDRAEPFGPLVLGMMQKRVGDPKGLGVLLGTQVGPNLGPSVRVAARGYVNLSIQFGENSRCSGGAYIVNGIFVGGARVQAAPWLGCDVELIEELLEIQGDWDFGAHAMGAAMLGPQLRVGKHFGIAVGVRAPNPWADESKWGGVLQFEVKDPLTGGT